jgi:multisubunit Na+/H+ antiporter MnhB subunit
MNKSLLWGAGVIGIVFLVIAGIYFLEPAKSLPHFFPGYDSSLAKTHYKHGIAALAVSLIAFAYVWFESGKGKKKSGESTDQKVD